MNPSNSSTEQNVIYNFDNYALDPKRRTLRHGQVVVELTPKLFQTLLILIENHDHVMSKDELLSRIWPEQVVEESNITQNISVLRKVLGEASRGKKYIETFPGHGYRFSEPIVIDRESHAAFGEDFTPRGIPAVGFPVSGPFDPDQRFQPIPAMKRSILDYRAYVISAILCLAIGASCSEFFLSRRRELQKQDPALRSLLKLGTLSGMGGAQYEPSWSPDGKQIAFVYSNRNDSESEIYIQSVDGIQPHRVVHGWGRYSSPVWSPDGKSLAYLHIQPDKVEIFILDIARSTSRKLTTLFPHRYGLNYRHLDWSPDGKMLVVDDKDVESDPLSLYLVYVSNGNRTRLTYPDSDIIGDVSPRFSPDGSQVAFIRIKYQFQNSIFIGPVTGGVARRLTERPSILSDVDWETNWSLIFSGKQNGEFRFWRLNLQSSPPRPMLASPIETGMPLQLSISRGSQQVAFSAYHPALNIWALDLSARDHLESKIWTRITRTSGQDIAPSFSPDGKEISFRSDVSGKMKIWVSRADGSHALRVNTGNMVPAVNCWSPDSNSIVFSPLKSFGLYEVSLLRQSQLRQITSLPVSHPFYSVKGKWIFARIHNFIILLPAIGGSPVQVTDEGGAPIVQSHDGRYVYFGHGRMSPTISRLDLRTKDQEEVINSLMPGYGESWTLTPKGIIFLTERSGRYMIAFHDFATGKERYITEFIGDLPPVGMSQFSVSPDERRLLVVRAEPVSANIQITAFRSANSPSLLRLCGECGR